MSCFFYCQKIYFFDGDNDMKLKYCFIILLLVCFLCGGVHAEDSNYDNVTSDLTLPQDNHAFDENLSSEEISDEVETNTDDVLGDGEEDVNEYDDIVFFDANAGEDGDGSYENPYKYLIDERIPVGSTAFLANGMYEFQVSESRMQFLQENNVSDIFSQVGNVNIIGEDCQNTFIYSMYPISFVGDNVVSGLTLIGTILNVLNDPGEDLNDTSDDVPSSLFMDNVIINSAILFEGSYILNNSKLVDGVALPFVGDDTFGGAIYALSPVYLELNNCSFKNNTADFGGAIYMEGGYLIMDNCSFSGNSAKNYGGAISVENTMVSITNSVFDDNDAFNDAGGAIYSRDSYLMIENTNVTSSSAVFGGAITSLNSTLSISKSKFKKNNAAFYGGAVFAMYGEAELTDNEFVNNSAVSGGGLFIDNSKGSVESDFINNSALIGSAIYSFNNEVSFDNVYDGDVLYETNKLNLTIYDAGEYPLFKYSPSNYTVLPDKYNLGDYGWVSSVKNQLTEGNCWAFTAIAVLESCILKASNNTYDFSEENMKNIMAVYSDYGWSYFMTNAGGGNMNLANGYYTSWFGPVSDDDDHYTNKGVLSPLLKSIFHVQNVVFLKRDSYTDNDMIKNAILNYGAVGTSMFYNDSYVNNETYAHYCGDVYEVGNHAITIVGWDDDYSASNFLTSPDGDGAWIVRNSWGSDWGINGYFYVSYYDRMFAPVGESESAYTIILNDTVKYDKNYQYDTSKVGYYAFGNETVTYYNIFTMDGDEFLAAVSTYFDKNYDYKMQLSVNGDLKVTRESSTAPGYYTIQLDEFVKVAKGDVVNVSFTITDPTGEQAWIPVYHIDYFTNNILTNGISYVIDGKETLDLYEEYDVCACIKAFTIVDEIKTQIALSIQDSQAIAIVTDQYGNVMNGDVEFKVNNKTQNIKITDGKAILNLNYYDAYNITVKWNKTGYEQSTNTTVYKTPWDATVKVEDAAYLEDVIINITLGEGKLLKNNLNITIGDYHYSLNQSNLIFTVPDNLNAQLWNVSIRYVTDNGYEKIVNESFSVNKKHISVFPLNNADSQKTSVRYNSSNSYDKIRVGTYDLIVKLEELQARQITYDLSLDDCIITCNGTDKTIERIGSSSFYLRNITVGTYKLNITLNHPNLEGSYYGDITITKGTTSLSIPELVITYGEGGQVTINSLASSVKLYKNPSQIAGWDDEKTDNDFYGGDISISGKTITVSPDLNQGTYDFTFIIDDDNYQSGYNNGKYSLSHFKVTVKKANSNVTVNVKDSLYNGQVIVDYAIDNINNAAIIPDGSVTVTVYNEKDEIVYTNTTATFRNEKGSFNISDNKFNAGTYTVNVNYSGAYNFMGNNTNHTFTIGKAESSFNSINDIVFAYGGSNTTVVDYTGASNVTAYVIGHSEANVVIAGNVIEVSGLSVGSYVLSVTTVPDGNHVAVTKNVTVTVNKANEKADIKIPELTSGKSNIIPITIGADAKGNVTLTIDNEIISVTELVNGSAVIEVPKLSSGNHIIGLTYSGDENHANFTQAQTLNIASLAKITSGNVNSYYGDGSLYKVCVFDDEGVPLGGAKVTFKVNGKTVAVKTTDKNGYATYKITQTPKSYSISAEANGLKTTNKLKVKQVIKAKKVTKVKKSRTTKIKITLKGKKPYKKKKLTIKFNGKKYKIKTNKKGVAKFKVTKKMLKKFKNGKKVKYTVIFKSDKLTRYLKIS